jgi:hypothetical protein
LKIYRESRTLCLRALDTPYTEKAEVQTDGLHKLAATVPAMCMAIALGVPLALASQVHGLVRLKGKLIPAADRPPVLKTATKEYQLTSATTYLLHTLQDDRLAAREIMVEGTSGGGDTFNVAKFFTVKNGKLYRVRYYCETCNIVALEPGRCVCCQEPTELQEIPVSSNEPDTVAVP